MSPDPFPRSFTSGAQERPQSEPSGVGPRTRFAGHSWRQSPVLFLMLEPGRLDDTEYLDPRVQADTKSAPALPPRPNPGPVPWPEPGNPAWIAAIGAAFLLLALFALVFLLANKRRRRRHPQLPPPVLTGSLPEPKTPEPDDRAGRLIAAAESVRRTLAERFGAPWRAKTTGEIAADPAVAIWLGGERTAAVLALLERADLLKFAGEVPRERASKGDDQGELERSEALAAAVEAAGATSKTTGK